MRNALFALALIAALVIHPTTAHADTIDDFTITGGGHTITYSLPATSSYPDFDLFNFFAESAPTTIVITIITWRACRRTVPARDRGQEARLKRSPPAQMRKRAFLR